MIPYSGWECPICESGNPIPRKRCKKCGRMKPREITVKQFFMREPPKKLNRKTKK
jgi:hypothetical protein